MSGKIVDKTEQLQPMEHREQQLCNDSAEHGVQVLNIDLATAIV